MKTLFYASLCWLGCIGFLLFCVIMTGGI
ncbi:hypothetical protein H3019_gp06 [Bacillus phage Karezi]|uniref:Uncharacterized protein n=1 Tax=Bacillus phage Karezi TaxID=2591398 RepID=A0A514AAS4_9CAUD|nr:hypothetical protein H3019_gp06 [Bacillus phage Karezi]QDH50359.1 hypothetical protein KAREZI_6 [Bacillus phage Karezi]